MRSRNFPALQQNHQHLVTYQDKNGVIHTVWLSDGEMEVLVKIAESKVMDFFRKFNQGEFPPGWRLGQSFVNHFGLSHPQCDVPKGPCLFHIRNEAKAAKAIWEHFTEVST